MKIKKFAVLFYEIHSRNVPISVASHLKSEAEPFEAGFEMVRGINEKDRLLNLPFVASSRRNSTVSCLVLV